ncbi:MAG: undecaprenyl-diphosphate phosphatase [Rikenellaceae bacterium]
MGHLESILLGILQGLTEFLSVSSSGHLEIFSHVLGVNYEEDLSFSIVLHAGTVMSTISVFWREILCIMYTSNLGVPKKWVYTNLFM